MTVIFAVCVCNHRNKSSDTSGPRGLLVQFLVFLYGVCVHGLGEEGEVGNKDFDLLVQMCYILKKNKPKKHYDSETNHQN